ncbi:O-methyltransferase [Leucobacter sp. M11]|uniref:O-methyltransferase n=1 Tax=Leucobacter sp. M11 TaxID=2993565 RepID=UPI002D7E4D60|nr:class I SAM-dependent methyltransferase [Leucobacter sp. M11]MEB4615956.1 class I SAM-dependent methyltransferase [Leucobacter sp. M11]
MAVIERNWQYVEQYPEESAVAQKARKLGVELGAEPVSRAVAAHLTSVSVISGARAILEIGTGVGVSGLALLAASPEATLTSIDIEAETQRGAKQIFAEAGIAPSRLRLITGDAHQVLPRMNTASYDLVLIDADPESLLEYLELSLTIVRPGGTVLIPRALNNGRVADPAARDGVSRDLRAILGEVQASPAIVAALSPAGDGVLTLTRVA